MPASVVGNAPFNDGELFVRDFARRLRRKLDDGDGQFAWTVVAVADDVTVVVHVGEAPAGLAVPADVNTVRVDVCDRHR